MMQVNYDLMVIQVPKGMNTYSVKEDALIVNLGTPSEKHFKLPIGVWKMKGHAFSVFDDAVRSRFIDGMDVSDLIISLEEKIINNENWIILTKTNNKVNYPAIIK